MKNKRRLNREYVMSLRLSVPELEAVRGAAKVAGESVAEFIRIAIKHRVREVFHQREQINSAHDSDVAS